MSPSRIVPGFDCPKRVTALILAGGNSATIPRAIKRIAAFNTDPVIPTVVIID